MFSSMECSIAWARRVLGMWTVTYPPPNGREFGAFCVVERTGGELAWPHDSPEISFQLWADSEDEAEELANMLAIATVTMPMDDPHVNAMGTPEVLSYGREEGGWFVWQVTVSLDVRLTD